MTLTQLFTAIANAIRAKMGTSNLIPAENFPTKIAEIQTGKLTNEEYNEAQDDLDDILENTVVPSGTINITTNGIIDVTNYVQANVNIVGGEINWSEIGYNEVPRTIKNGYNYAISIKNNWENLTDLSDKFNSDKNLMVMPLVDTSNATNVNGIFNSCRNLIEIPQLNTSSVTNMSGMFINCINLTKMPQLNTSNVTTTRAMFQYCNSLTEIPLLDTSKAKNMSNMFSDCVSLIQIPQLSTSSATSMSGMFNNCSNLSDESLNNILGMCIGATSYAGTKTLKYIGLSSSQVAICETLSNYQSLLAAGWTTGY